MTREIEARLKLSAVDRTASAFKSVSGRMAAVDAKAKAVTAASSRMAGLQAAAIARAAGVVSTAAVGMAAKRAITDFAEVDRRLTRIGITADAGRDAVAGVLSTLFSIAQETATPIEQVTSGLEDLVAQGKSLPEALAFLPAVARTAAASGAEVKDMAASTGALADSLRISSGEMQQAFDILVAGGKAGKFELKDMSQYLPSLAPMAAAVGLKGTEGLKRLTAMLQIVRNQTGQSSEAATNLTNVFQKMESEETTKKFEKFGVDLRKEMAKARKEDKDLTDVFLDLSEKALKGDLSKIPQLFGDMQVASGMRALLSQRDALRKLQAALNDVDGSTLRDLAAVTDDAKASLDRLGNSWNHFVVNVGRSLDNFGATKALSTLADMMERLNNLADAEAKKAGGGREEYLAQARKDGVDRATAEEVWGFFTGARTSAEKARTEAADKAVSPERRRRAEAEMARLDKIKARYGAEPLPAVLQAQYDAARATLAREPRDYGQRFAPVVDRARLAAGDAQRFPAAREVPPVSRSRLDLEALPMPRPKPVDIPTKLDDREIEGEMQRLRARLQSSLDANPLVLRTRVDPARAPLDTGRSFKGGDFTGAP